ncbi:Mobile element protein [Desulfovibrio sp. TomC]|nr:Mobile element protein [Desulfovibrio sp. TomC]
MNLELMRHIDEQFLETPFYGSRQMRRHLRHQGIEIGRGRVRRLMRKMGLVAIYQKPRTSAPHPEHKIHLYLLRDLAIKRPDQVWCADITYVPMKRGFLYLVAVMDWHSRAVLFWCLSNTLDADFCVAALEEAMNETGRTPITRGSAQGRGTVFSSKSVPEIGPRSHWGSYPGRTYLQDIIHYAQTIQLPICRST